MSVPVVFVDTETISLNRDHRHLWEIAIIWQTPDGAWKEESRTLKDVPLEEAEPAALRIGRFYERYRQEKAVRRELAAIWVEERTRGKHLVGAVPSFDEERLWGLLKAYGQCPGWHYHLIDVEALAAGFIMGRETEYSPSTGQPRLKENHSPLLVETARPPWNSNELSENVGVSPDDFDRHTALGDARWAKAIYEKVIGQ